MHDMFINCAAALGLHSLESRLYDGKYGSEAPWPSAETLAKTFVCQVPAMLASRLHTGPAWYAVPDRLRTICIELRFKLCLSSWHTPSQGYEILTSCAPE